jgi:TRAP transporter 4TM/12TM fusion protein
MFPPAAPSLRRVVQGLYYLTAVFFFAYLVYYYFEGEGGPTLLAVAMVPVTFVLFVLDELRKDGLYPSLGVAANHVIGAVYIALALVSGIYMHREFFDIQTVRAGFWNTTDLLMGGMMVLLIMEYARKRYVALFVINVILVLYAAYGQVVPGLFGHPGLDWERIVTAMSVEMSTGVYSRLPQLALTVIGSFLLVLSVLRAFGCVDSILLAASRIAVRSPHALPQSAVLGSFGVGMVSGSGAANAATTGSATIPAMIAAGMPRATAGAIETASSLGGQLMPPIMGISAFLMADFLNVGYFDVVARGYVPAIVYFVSIAIGVYLLSVHHQTGRTVALPGGAFDWGDGVNLAAFALVVLGLVGLMGLLNVPPMTAALYAFVAAVPTLFVFHAVRRLRMNGRAGLGASLAPVGRLVDGFASMTADLTLLLATLSIMTGAFVITGVPTKIGTVLIEAAGINLAAMVLVAFVFGALLGTGLPPAPTYILTALVIAPPMIKVGVDPWVVHFFSFFLAVWGELTPPTSVVAAVAAKIADASFGATLARALMLCVALFMLMAGVFVRPELVLEPGWGQLGAGILILLATVGVVFSLQARFSDAWALDVTVRLILAALALVVLLRPSVQIAGIAGPIFGSDAIPAFLQSRELPACLAAVGVLAVVAYWVVRLRPGRPRAAHG